ncbi:MAG: 30S ribosomal protein S4e [Candidatus Hydrothermarchaeaceae archaeon]
MGKHLKRLNAPKSWKIPRKKNVWVAKPRPGPHRLTESLPLLLVLRDYLGLAETTREVKRIINEGNILVDKKVRLDYRFPVGLMDIIEIPDAKERRIVLLDKKGNLILKKLSKKNTNVKLCKIKSKTVLNGGSVQLNLHDGKNILVKSAKEDVYKTKDTLVIDLKTGKISSRIPYKKGNIALITGGSHRASVAKIDDITVLNSPQPNVVTLGSGKEKFKTIEDHVFLIGEKEPAIPEVAK